MAKLADLMRQNGAAVDVARLEEYIVAAHTELAATEDEDAKKSVAVRYNVPQDMQYWADVKEVHAMALAG
jgi:hypothetical protein